MQESSMSVIVSNSLTRAAYNLSLDEKRLLMLAVSKLHHSPGQLQRVEVSSVEYAEQYSLKPAVACQALKAAAENLWTRMIVSSDNTKYRWIITRSYDHGVIALEFHPRVLTYLPQLKRQFTPSFLHRAADFNLMYTWRLFELIIRFKKAGYLKVDLDEFKTILDIPSAYDKDFGKVRQKVIHPAISEIREKDGLNIQWKPIKTGRKVTAIEFTFPVEQQHELFVAD